jgi:hypothetical protein
MVLEITRCGLIVTPARRTSDLLEELISQVDWPVLLAPSIRLLFQQIEITAPHCLLFWLDEAHEIEHALQLIARLRDRGPRPYRVAIAHRLQPDAEPAIRAAGVHSVLSTNGSIAALVQDALLPLLNMQPQMQPLRADREYFRPAEPLIRGPTNARASPAEVHPP